MLVTEKMHGIDIKTKRVKSMKQIFLIFTFISSGLIAHDKLEDPQTETYHFSIYQIEHLDAYFHYGLGDFTLEANKTPDSIDGNITFYPDKIEPDVRFAHNDNTGVLKVEMDSFDRKKHDDDHVEFDLNLKNSFDTYRNSMNFQLPTTVVTNLEVDFGLGSANLDLTDIPLSNLDIDCGLSDVFIEVSNQNPIACSQVNLTAGLGDLDVRSLGHLNARTMDIEVGLGSANIDLRGSINQDIDIDIDIGLGDMDIILPEDANVQITVSHSFLSSVEIRDLVKKDDEIWISPDWKAGRPNILVSVDIGLGSIDIDLRD